MNTKKMIGAMVLLSMLAVTPALAAGQTPDKTQKKTNVQSAKKETVTKPAAKTKEEPQVIQNAELSNKAKQSLEKMKTILPDLKNMTAWNTTLTKQSVNSFYQVTMTTSKDSTYPFATFFIAENTGEIRAFNLTKDRPSYPLDYLNNKDKTPELEKARKAAKESADKLMKEMLGEKAANYVADEVNFGGGSQQYTMLASITYEAKGQSSNAPRDTIIIHIDASGAPVMFLHYF